MLWIWYIVLLGYIMGSIFLLYFPDVYVVELGISFLPYMLWGGVACTLFALLYIWSRRKKDTTIQRVLWYGLLFLRLCAVGCVGVFWYRYAGFYKTYDVSNTSTRGKGLSLLYGNIRYQNQDTDELLRVIDAYTPDMIFFVEYTPTHHADLFPKLSELYPYINTEYPERAGPAGKVVYSKYPFDNLAPKLEGSAQWKYGYVSLVRENQEYIFYLVHTSAPVSPLFLRMRNRQLQALQSAVLHDMQHVHPDAVMLILGDFNVSPWSKTYADMQSRWSAFDNITRYLPGLMTWGYGGAWPYAHIDHIRVNREDSFTHIEDIPIQGSDHDLLYVEFDF